VTFIRLSPVVISILLLAAHYYRAGHLLLVIIFSASVLLLFVMRPWVAAIIRTELVIGVIEWMRTAHNLVLLRQSMNEPWVRLLLILGGVALFTFASIFIFKNKSIAERYRIR
jgi:hypothetical protein